MAKGPCPNGYRMNRKGRCVPQRSGEIGLATYMAGIIGAFIGGNKQKEKEEERAREMRKENIQPGEPIKSGKPKQKKGGTVFSRSSRKNK